MKLSLLKKREIQYTILASFYAVPEDGWSIGSNTPPQYPTPNTPIWGKDELFDYFIYEFYFYLFF